MLFKLGSKMKALEVKMEPETLEVINEFKVCIRKAILMYIIFWALPALAVAGSWIYIAIKFIP